MTCDICALYTLVLFQRFILVWSIHFDKDKKLYTILGRRQNFKIILIYEIPYLNKK